MNTPIYKYARVKQGNIRLLLLALLALFTMKGYADDVEVLATNSLSIGTFEGRIGKTVNIPVYLSNEQEVVAAQFDIELPFAITKGGTATLTNRANQHSVSFKDNGDKQAKIVVMSMQNNAFRGNSGLLLRIPMDTYDDGNTAKPYPIRLTNIVLTDRQGNNIASSTEVTGYFTVSRDDLPDLIVPTVTPAQTTANPGESFSLSYEVKNDGTGETKAGWTEKIYFESAVTGVRNYIGTQYFGNTLKAGETVSRKFTTILAQQLHTDGTEYIVVEVTPDANCGELLVDQGNNTGRSTATVELGKKLTVTTNKLTLDEGYHYRRYYYNYRDNIALTVTRSGDWSTDEQFPLTCSVEGLLYTDNGTLHTEEPVMITIPARSASKTVYIYATDDQIVRAREATLTIGQSNGYNDGSVTISRTDNDTDPLTLTVSLNELTEGKDKQLTLTLTRGGEYAEDVTFPISCSQPQRFTPANAAITIHKGLASASVTLTLVDDDTPQADTSVLFSTQATDYKSASASVRVNDDDRPVLTLTLIPNTVSESAGSQAATAIISRDRGYDKETPMVVRLSSASESNAYFAERSVTFQKGDREKEVKVGVTDNSAVDGTRRYDLTAALYLSASNSIVGSGDRASSIASLTVINDESPYLTVTSNSALVGENSSFTIMVTRFVSSFNSEQVVNLVADKASDVSMPSSVTIAAGRSTAYVTVNVKGNEQMDDERMLYITASANGLASGQFAARITDRTLPDATCTTAGYDGSQLFSGMEATFSPTIINAGTAVLPADMQVDFFLAPSDRLYSYTRTTPVFTVRTDQPVAIGESRTFKFTGVMPAAVGTYYLYARLNADGGISEFSTSNNLSTQPARVNIAAPFSVTELKVEQESYLPGQTAKITGRVSGRQTDGLKNQRVSITLEGTGQSRKSTTCLVDEQTGAFTAFADINASASGIISVNARALGQTEADMTASFNVWNLSLTADKTTWTLDEGYPKSGTFTLRNTSGKTVTGLTISRSALPFGCELSDLRLSTTTLAAGASTTVSYTVNPTTSTSGSQYATFTVTAVSAEGAKVELPIRYYCRATDSKLVFERNPLSTTLQLETTRTYQVRVVNKGLKATGPIDLNVPTDLPWLVCKSQNPMASIEPGKDAYITFELRHQPGMHSGQTFSAYLSLNPETGAEAGVKMNVTVVGTEYSKFTVDCEDIFVRARRDYSHVSAAQVRITDVRTGKDLMTGLTDGAGHWMTDRLTQGSYYVTVSALRHSSVRQLLYIGPGDEQQMSFFLPYKAVLTNFVATQDAEDGSYHLTSTIDIDHTAPQAIVIPELPENGFECGSQDFNLTLRNVGTFAANDVQLRFPSSVQGINTTQPLFTVEQPTVSIAPGAEIVLPVHYEGPEAGRRRVIAQLLMHYGFNIAGLPYSEDDNYQSFVGCVTAPSENPPIIDPTPPAGGDDDPDQPSGGDGGGEIYNNGPDGLINEADTAKIGPDVALPTYGSSISLKFDDIDHIYVGEPFYATLTVDNGQSGQFRNIVFTHMVSDDSDDYETDMTTLFTCMQESATGFTTQGGAKQLAGNSSGTIRLKFVPQDNVQADRTHVYYIGGQFSYIDGGKGIANSVVLAQLAVTIDRKGKASVIYLTQKDYLGNGIVDEQNVTAVPGHNVIIVRNDGQSAISGLNIHIDEPAVIDNKTGEGAVLQTLSAVIGSEATNSLFNDVAIDTLHAEGTTVANWTYQSQTDSHLTGIEGLAASVSGTADNDLQLDVVGTHSLYRAISVPAGSANGANASAFLLDDEEDEDRLPDNVMTVDGSLSPLQIVADKRIEGVSGTYTVKVNAPKDGWIYFRLNDPTNGMMQLETATRGQLTLGEGNAWQTDHTVLSDYSAVSEHLVHIADSVKAGENVYTLNFTAKPGAPIRLMSCHLYTADGTEVKAGEATKKRVTKAQIEFTQDLKLVKNHLSLFAADERVDKGNVDINEGTTQSVWTIDMSRLDAVPGLHYMSINVAKLKSPTDKSLKGEGLFEIEWTEDIKAQAHLDFSVAPDEKAGSIGCQTGDYDYGMLTVKATPAKGYQFDYWTVNGERVDTAKAEFNYEVKGRASLQANFSKQFYNVAFECDEGQGFISGSATGYYEWQQQLTVTAVPNEGHHFEYWKKGDEKLTDQTLTILVDDDCTYVALFAADQQDGIDEHHLTATQPNAIYSVDGRQLRQGVTNVSAALRSLPAGLYIVGGHKVVKR